MADSKQLGIFPFGQPVQRVVQQDRTHKPIFVLGVYASAVHALWAGNNDKKRISALAVASEPCIFWRGDYPESIIKHIEIPEELGILSPAAPNLNGPSGKALDDYILKPLGAHRKQAWLCDMVPYSCVNSSQKAVIEREYNPYISKYGLPIPSVPELPHPLIDRYRHQDILAEIEDSHADYLILLGDQPIKWFLSAYESSSRKRNKLAAFGTDNDSYGRLLNMNIGDRCMQVLPLAHPRQIAKLGKSSIRWYELHQVWIKNTASSLLRTLI